ncbi:MAG: hypothetical protein KDC33_10880 [Thermoleophilia bacterium]|nr:hypothetical protein [Thermoleophilia bacterium]
MIAPHIRYPLVVSQTGGLAAVDQDTPAEVAGCVHAVIRHRQGARYEDPGFGVPDATFTRGETLATDVVEAIGRWEPRAVPGVNVDVVGIARNHEVHATVEVAR